MELESQHQLEKLINDVIDEMESMIDGNVPMKKNEIIVGEAIINILKYWHLLFMEDTPEGNYNKKVTCPQMTNEL